MEFEYLDINGSLFPKSWFVNCFYLVLFTRHKCKPCKFFINKLKQLYLSNHTNIVPVIISMDKTIEDWDKCCKIDNWLTFPFFPVKNRNRLFKKFRVDRLPFLVVADEDCHFIIPNDILKSNVSVLQEYIDFTISCFNIEEFEII